VSPYLRDALERIAWATAYTGVSASLVELTNYASSSSLSGSSTATIMSIGVIALSALKNTLAKHIGDPNSASMLKGKESYNDEIDPFDSQP
jgi:hypothetical protein